MLSETEKTLSKFKSLHEKQFYNCALDIKPTNDRNGEKLSTSYGYFQEQDEVYSLMYCLHLELKSQIFIGNYDEAYSNPMEPISIIKELYEYLKSKVFELEEILSKQTYQFFPIVVTLESYRKTSSVIEYVLSLPEIKKLIEPSNENAILSDLIEMKVKNEYRKKILKILLSFLSYSICLFLPIISIIISWARFHENKYFQLALYIFPLLGFLYDRKSFINNFKFIFSIKYRHQLKLNIKDKVLSHYT